MFNIFGRGKKTRCPDCKSYDWDYRTKIMPEDKILYYIICLNCGNTSDYYKKTQWAVDEWSE